MAPTTRLDLYRQRLDSVLFNFLNISNLPVSVFLGGGRVGWVLLPLPPLIAFFLNILSGSDIL